jgi:hypothetical protein
MAFVDNPRAPAPPGTGLVPVPATFPAGLEGTRAQPAPWRAALLPAAFRNAHFHCETGSRRNGRRIVTHEFPKKELPWSEDMGRRAKEFTVRAYCITYPTDLGAGAFVMGTGGDGLELYKRDYRIARDLLLSALEQIGPGTLQLPLLPAENVVVTQYQLTEEERLGGYCVFDIQFSEYGQDPRITVANGAAILAAAAQQVQQTAVTTTDTVDGTENPSGPNDPGNTFSQRFGSWSSQAQPGAGTGGTGAFGESNPF